MPVVPGNQNSQLWQLTSLTHQEQVSDSATANNSFFARPVIRAYFALAILDAVLELTFELVGGASLGVGRLLIGEAASEEPHFVLPSLARSFRIIHLSQCDSCCSLF